MTEYWSIDSLLTCGCNAATEMTDHTIENEMMTAIWSHGQKEGDTPGLGYFYGPDEVKYHAGNRGRLTMNFHG